VNETITARLAARTRTSEGIESLWKAEQSLTNLPDLRFAADGNKITISVAPRHGGKVPIQEIKRPF
jgi:hypothetical protein